MYFHVTNVMRSLILSLVFSTAAFAFDQAPVTVDVEGYASIAGGNKDAARESALNNAFRRAVEQVIGVMIDSKTVVQDSLLLNDKIYSKSSGFIKTYKITGERFESDACRINVSATVSTAHLERGLDDIGLLSKKLGKPRLAIIMTEQNMGTDEPSGSLAETLMSAGIAESVLHEVFAKKGYNLVDQETLVAIARNDAALSSAKGTDPADAALLVAAGGGADVVIIGKAIAKTAALSVSGTNMRTSQASVSARVVDADTGQLVASYSASANAAHINPTAGGAEAIRKASNELAQSLNRQIAAKWSRKVNTRTARVVIRNAQFADIAKIRALMRERLNLVESTEEHGYVDGTLTLDTEINGSVKDLGEEITRTAMDGYKFKVTSFTANTLNLQLSDK